MLQNTVDVWISELSEGAVREAAKDARLALQADLWCESVSHAPRDKGEQSEDFRPLLLPWPPLASSTGEHVRVSQRSGHVGRGLALGFEDEVPAEGDIAALCLEVPSPPVPCVLMWQPASCALKELPGFQLWLKRALAWLAFVLLLCPQRDPL